MAVKAVYFEVFAEITSLSVYFLVFLRDEVCFKTKILYATDCCICKNFLNDFL